MPRTAGITHLGVWPKYCLRETIEVRVRAPGVVNFMELVSVIIPAYNAELYVGNAIESVLAQTYHHLEIIVVDDGSTDDTWESIRAIHDSRIQMTKNEGNHGPAAARNCGMKACHGDWVAFLDSDDWWHPMRIEKLLALAYRTSAHLVADDLWLIENGRERPWTTYLKDAGVAWRDTHLLTCHELASNDLGMLKPIVQRLFLIQNEIQYLESMRHEDFIFLLDCLQKNPLMVVTPEPLYFYRNRRGSLSASVATTGAKWLETVEYLEKRYSLREDLADIIRYYRKLAEQALFVGQVRSHIEQRQWTGVTNAFFSQREMWPLFGNWLIRAAKRKIQKTRASI